MVKQTVKKASMSKNSDKEESDNAVASALRLLARRDHSVSELERKLRTKAVSDVVVANVIVKLRQAGYLDDRRFAERWAESAVRNGRAYGPRLRLELARRGVDPGIIAEVVAGIASTSGEEEALSVLLAKKFAGLDPLCATEREKRRVIAYLQRRGFSIAAILRSFRAIECCQDDL